MDVFLFCFISFIYSFFSSACPNFSHVNNKIKLSGLYSFSPSCYFTSQQFFFLKSLHLIFSIPVPRNHSLFPCSLYCCSLCLVKLQILKLLLICCLIQYVFSSLHLTVLHETEDFSQHSF